MAFHVGIYGDAGSTYGNETLYSGTYTLEVETIEEVVESPTIEMVYDPYDPDLFIRLKAVIGGN